MLKYSAKSVLRFLFAAVSCSVACAAQSQYWYPCPYDPKIVCANDNLTRYSLCHDTNWGNKCGTVNGDGVLWVLANCGTAGNWVKSVHFPEIPYDGNLVPPAASSDEDQSCTWK